MRKIDKKYNIIKANILTEQRYIENKMGVCENEDFMRGDEIVWISEPKDVNGYIVKPNEVGEYIGREGSGEEVVAFGPNRFYTTRGTFQKKDGLTGESLKRDTSNSTKSSSEPNKKVVGSDNVNSLRKVASDPYKVKKALDSQNRYTESED